MRKTGVRGPDQLRTNTEIPRVLRLLEERIADVAASGCTPIEANIIAFQVVEAQKRTLDEDKQRRLSNVLVNGLCEPTWDKVKHRLLVRLASELEEEHIEILRRQARTPEEWQREHALHVAAPHVLQTPVELHEARAIALALERELIARGLLTEVTKPKIKMQRRGFSSDRPAVENVELETRVKISSLGRPSCVPSGP